jgi:tetratricopeptide (TPR) repeat protein
VACYVIGELRRAGEWTDATMQWCEQMPGAGPFLGICRVHRAQILHVRGAWEDAEREAQRVCGELAHFDAAIVAEAHYLLGELRRQRGDLPGAEAAFRKAHELGRDPQPGLALLRLAQGEVATARASIRAALAAAGDDPVGRARLLPAAVNVALGASDPEQASAWCEELAATADRYNTARLIADARRAQGAVLLADDQPAAAVPALRAALHAYQDLDALYDLAGVRHLLGRAYAALGDEDAAALEQQVAASLLGDLGIGAAPARAGRRGRGGRAPAAGAPAPGGRGRGIVGS